MGSAGRQQNRCDAPFSNRAFQPHLSIHRAREVTRNCQPESDPRVAPGGTPLHLEEWLKDVLNLIARDSHTRVAHPYPDETIAAISADPYVTAPRCELHCVCQEVDEDLAQLVRICPHCQLRIAMLARESELLSLELRADQCFKCPDGVSYEQRLHVDLELARLDSGEAQHIVD